MADSYVGKPCPKCKHIRAAAEIAPDWQCPKCGVAYAKFLAAQQGLSTTMGSTTLRPAGAGAIASAPAQASGSTGLGVFAHVSLVIGFVIPFFGLIVPIVIWMMKKGENEFAVSCAKEAINFQISFLLWMLVVVGGGVLLSFVLAPLLYLIALLAGLMVLAVLVLPIIAAVKASGGESYYYPRIWHIFE